MSYEDGYKDGVDDLIRTLAHADGCCPATHVRDDTCPGYYVQPDKKGLSCSQCWTNYIEGLS